MVEELEQETQQDPIPPLPKGFKVVKSNGGGDLPPLPQGYSVKKKDLASGGIGGTVGSSKAQLNVSIEPQNPKDNPFGIGQQFNQPQKLEAEKLDLSNTQKNAAIAEQIKEPLRKIPNTPILDNTKIQKPISDIDANEAIARQQQHKKDLETAIDNTTLKVLKQKGIVAGKGSPYYEAERKKIEEKTKPTMIGGIVINGAEATYHKDKNGNIGLDRNLGFLEGIRKGFNSAVEGEDEANAFAEMDTKQKVEYANKQMEGKPTEYMEERGGVGELLGGAAPYLVKAAAAATLATAAGIAAPETGGASLVGAAPVLTVLLTAPDMIKQGQKDEVMTRYMQLKQENPFSKDEDLMKIAEEGEISGGIVGAAEALAFTTTLKLPIAKESKDVLTNYMKGVASSAVHLGGIMSGTTAAKIAERKLEGYNVDTDKAIDEITTAFTENATAGAILNGIISGAHILPKVVKSAFKYALKDTPTSEIKTALQANVEAGRIPPEVAEQTIADIEGYKVALAKTADGLKPETQASVAGLIQARDNVAAEMATKDPTQREVYEQKIEAYNKQIEKITKTNDPLKYEIDEVTGNPIDKVAPKGESEKISEPIELSVETKPKNAYTEQYEKALSNPELREDALKEISDQWHDTRSRKLIEESITPEIIKEAKEKYPQEENSGLTIPEPKPTDVVVDNTTPKGNTSNVGGDVESFETARGSVYTYGDDGKTTRFKTATNEQNEPQDLTVFADFKGQQEDNFLEAIHRSKETGDKVYVVDENGKVIRNNKEALGKKVNLVIVDKDGKVTERAYAEITPKMGSSVFDMRSFEKDGETYTQRHIGNKVTKINYKEQSLSKQESGGKAPVTKPEGKSDVVVDAEQLSGKDEVVDNTTPKGYTSNVVPVFHHTKVAPEDFDFGNFQRGKNQVSQFGDGLAVSTDTTPFLENRYGKPIKGEVKNSDFVEIDTNKTEKEIYEELKAKGYKFNKPDRGSYIGNDPAKEYDGNEKANEQPAIISLFNDFQKSNPEVKGVKITNHIIGNEKVSPFYVIYDNKSFYGEGSLREQSLKETTKAETPTTNTGVEEGSGVGGDVVGKTFRDNYNRTFEVKGENAGILTLEDVDTGKVLRKKKSEVLSDFKEITEPDVVDKTKTITEHLPKGGELKGVTEIDVSENGEEVSYGTKTRKTSITVKGLSAEEIKQEIKFEKQVLERSKRDAANFNEDEIRSAKGMTRQEKEDAIKMHKQSLINNEQVEKIVIPFYEKHLEIAEQSLKETTKAEAPKAQPKAEAGSVGVGGDVDATAKALESLNETDHKTVEDINDKLYQPKYVEENKAREVIESFTHYKSGSNKYPATKWARWFQSVDANAKKDIVDDIKNNPELRNSMLSLLYDLYKKEIGFKGSFDEFILEPIKLYRGVTDADKKGKGQEGFSAYSISKNRVSGYAHNRSSENPEVREVTVRPIDTYGAVNYIMGAEVEVLLPQSLSKETLQKEFNRLVELNIGKFSENQKSKLEQFYTNDDYIGGVQYAKSVINGTHKTIAEAYHKAKADGTNPELVKAVEQSLKETTKAETPTPKGNTSNAGGDVEVKEGFTEGKDLNKIFVGLKEKYGDKKGSAIYDAANRLVNPNKNTIVEIRSNGVVVKEGEKYLLKPFGNTDANSKKWTLYKGLDVTDQFAKSSETKTEPIKNEEAQAPQNTKQTDGTIPTESKVDEVVSDSGKGEKGSKEPPPSEPAEPVGEGDGKKDGITHAAVEELRKIIGEPEYEGKPVEKHETLIEEAQKKIKENPNAANEVLDKMENNGKITNKDNAIMAIYKATIDAEMAKNPTPELLQRATRLSKALDVSGTELGKALESRKLVGQEDNLTNFLLDKQAAQGTALTETQLKSEAAKYEKLKEAHDALEKQLEVEREQHAKDIAEMGVNKAKAKAKRESKKSSEDYKKERKDTVEAARKALKDIRDNPQASAAPVFRELVAIAPHVKEYVNSLVSEGVDKLDNIVTAVHAEFKDVLEGLSKRDVLNIMAGDYNTKPKDQTRNEKANTARLLEREAKLLKELERERKGEEKAKSESQKTQSNRRIDELKEKIKEVRRQNKNREVDTESPEDMTAGEIEYNAKLQKSLTEKAQKLTNDIRDKKYLEEEPAKPVFKKSRKTQLLEDKVIDLENKIRHERSKDEYNKRSTLRKGFDKVMEVLGVRRLVQSALDMSVPFRQGATMLSPRKIDVWAKGFKANLQSVFNPKKFERIMSAIRNDPMYHEMVKDNIVFNDLGSADPNLHNEDFRKSFVYKIPILSEPLKASNRSADAFLNVARIEMYKKLRSNLEKRGLTRESDPKAFKFIGNWTMAMTGRGTMHSALEKPAMNAVLGNTFYGARLMASRFNLLNPVTYFDPRIPKEAKREAMKDMAAFTLTMVSVATALSYTTGAKISLDPDDSDFLQLRYGDKVYDISGGLANYVRTGLRILKAGYTKATGTKSQGDKSTDNAGKSVMNFFRNKLSPNTAYGVDAFFGGRYGNDFDKSDIYRIYPMYTEDFIQAIKEEGGLTATATVLLPNILGIGYGSYASKGQIDKKLDDLLERNMRSDEMNSEKIFNYKDGGRAVTFKEFNDFADKRDEKIKKDIEVLFEKGIGGKPYKDLTQEQVVDETNFIKANATREVKKAMFGENKKDTKEKSDDKKLLEERKRKYKNN